MLDGGTNECKKLQKTAKIKNQLSPFDVIVNCDSLICTVLRQIIVRSRFSVCDLVNRESNKDFYK